MSIRESCRHRSVRYMCTYVLILLLRILIAVFIYIYMYVTSIVSSIRFSLHACMCTLFTLIINTFPFWRYLKRYVRCTQSLSIHACTYVHVHQFLADSSSIANPQPMGKHSVACSGKPRLLRQKLELPASKCVLALKATCSVIGTCT